MHWQTPLRLLLVSFACLGVAPRLTRAADTAINTSVAEDQERQGGAQLTNGTLVFVYEDESVTNNRILLRRFDAALAPLGAEQRVDVLTNAEHATPVVAALSGGGFVVAFAVKGLDADGYAVGFRRYDANATALDAATVRANTITNRAQFHPEIAPLTNGGFVLTWLGKSVDTGQDVYYRRFAANGTSADSQDVMANGLGTDAVNAGDQGSQKVTALKDGGFVIVYEDRASEDVFAVRVDVNGNPVTAPGEASGNFQFQVNATTAYEQTMPAVAGLTNGGFVVIYNTETNGTAASRRLVGRVFPAAGAGGAEFNVGGHTNRWQDGRVAGVPNGDFVAAWQAQGEGVDAGTNTWSVFEQRFSPAGVPRFTPFMVNAYNSLDQRMPTVTGLGNSGYVIAWTSFGQDTSRDGIYARAFLPNNEIPGVLTIRAFPQSNSVAVNFVGQAGRQHQLQRSSNFTTWTGVLTTNSPTGVFQYNQPYPGASPFFFRVQSL